MYIVGNATIYLGLVLAILSFLSFVLGAKRENQKLINLAKVGTIAVFLQTSLAVIGLLYVLGTSQFQYEYVHNYTSSDLPLAYKLASLWAGNAGSLLLWTFFLTMYTVMLVFSRGMKNNPISPYVAAVMLGNTFFFYLIISMVANPFGLLDEVPLDGKGLNPMLQNWVMLLHPVALYLGYVGLAVPFAFAIGTLLLKNMDNSWLRLTRRWTIFAWLFLTIGNILGGQWAYMELGWGGYWAWDPVENASFMPWLTVTAFLHTAMIQERKNMLKVWNFCLIFISYALTLFGTFLVRSGIITSVHAFANSNLGNYFLYFMVIAVCFSLYVLLSRYHLLKRETGQIETLLSKENSFLVGSLLLAGAAFAVFWGTIYPLVSEAVYGSKATVDQSYYNTVEAQLLLAVIFVMGISPLVSWQRSSVKNVVKDSLAPTLLCLAVGGLLFGLGVRQAWPIIGYGVVTFMIYTHCYDFYRGIRAHRKTTGEPVYLAFARLISKNNRRYGGYIVHIGVACMVIGIIGSNNFAVETIKTIVPGSSIEVNGYTLTYVNIAEKKDGANIIIHADLLVTKADEIAGIIRPEKIFYKGRPEPSTEVGLLSTWKEDVYVVLSSWDQSGRATFVVNINPMMNWIWFGGLVMVFGGGLAIWKNSWKFF